MIRFKPVQLLDKGSLPNEPNVRSKQKGGNFYGTDIVDRLASALVWWSAQLGLSLVWLRSLGHRRVDTNYRPDSVPVGPNLRALSAQRSEQ